jgi:hypothetical protein
VVRRPKGSGSIYTRKDGTVLGQHEVDIPSGKKRRCCCSTPLGRRGYSPRSTNRRTCTMLFAFGPPSCGASHEASDIYGLGFGPPPYRSSNLMQTRRSRPQRQRIRTVVSARGLLLLRCIDYNKRYFEPQGQENHP